MISLQVLFDTAVLLHQSGKLTEAVALYERVLPQNPENGQLLFLIGTACQQLGRSAPAADFLRQSIEHLPENPAAHNNYGNALRALGHFGDAIGKYDKAIGLKPDYVEAYCNRALACRDLGRIESALASFEQALALRPDHVEALSGRGAALNELGRHEEALRSCDDAIALCAGHAAAHFNRGNVLIDLGRPELALASYDRAISCRPDYAEAFSNRALVLRDCGRLEDALASCNEAIAIRPDYADAYFHRGIVLRELNFSEAATASFNEALRLDPSHARAYCERGNSLYRQGRAEEALSDYERAVTLKSDYAEAYSNRGNALKSLGLFEQALSSFGAAISISANSVSTLASAYCNRGNVFHDLLRDDEALADYEKSIELNPQYAEAHWNKALTLLRAGCFVPGWALYEWRMKRKRARAIYSTYGEMPWRGLECVRGKRLLVYGEQGLGDVIQFSRYLPRVAALGAKVLFSVRPALVPLLETLSGEVSVLRSDIPMPEFDAHCPLMSLPFVFGTNSETIPREVPYLRSDPAKAAAWERRLGPRERLRVGLAWSGSASHENDRHRSIPLDRLSSLAALPFEFHSLQNEYRAGDFPAPGVHAFVRRHDDVLKDFSDTAALVEAMDLVISVDTSVAHLAGALGKTVWILLPYSPDFRWMLAREDSPWYPSARLFRQPSVGDWASVVSRVCEALRRDLGSSAG